MKNIFNRKSAFMKLLSVWTAFSVAASASAPALAGTVAVLGGNSELADLTRVTMDSNTADAAVFSSTEPSGVLDWTKFNIGTGQSMTFNGAATTFFNLVDGAAGKSQIDGIINGSGNVWVINPAGVAFGASSKVDLGSLFVAAAGNVMNADALRDGIVDTKPIFSAFNGDVTVAAGSKFSVDQAVLFGKKVSVAGNFTDVTDLMAMANGGEGNLIIENIGGGQISWNMSGFSIDDTEVSLGDLDVGGTLSIIDSKKININGTVSAGEDVFAMSTFPIMEGTGEISVSGTLKAGGDIELGAIGSGQNIDISGTVEADGYVDIDVNTGLNVSGAVSAGGDLRIDGGGIIMPVGGTGDVTIDGSLTAGGDISITSPQSLNISTEGSVVAGGNLSAGSSMAPLGQSEVSVDGTMRADGQMYISSAKKINIGADGNVSAGQGLIISSGGIMMPDMGDISVDGTVNAAQDMYIMAEGNLDIGGSVYSLDHVYASAGSSSGAGFTKDLKLSGNVGAAGGVYISAYEGSVDIAGGSIASDNAVCITSAKDVNIDGSITALGDVQLSAAEITDGALSVDGTLEAGGDVRLFAGSPGGLPASLSNVKIGNANIMSYGGNMLIAGTDNVTVGESSKLIAGNTDVETLAGDITINGVFKADSAKFNAAKSLSVVNENNQINNLKAYAGENIAVVAKKDIAVSEVAAYGSSVNIKSLDGSIDVADSIIVGAASGSIKLDGKYGVSSSGKLSVEYGRLEVYGNKGDINLYKDAKGVVLAGEIILVAEGNVYANNPKNVIGGIVKAQAGLGKELKIDVGTGEMVTIGDIYADTAFVRSEKGTIKVVGDVSAPDKVYLETEQGDIIVMEGCTVEARGDGAVIVLRAGRNIVNDGTLKSDGAIDLAAGRDIAGSGMVSAVDDVIATAGDSIGLKAANGISLGDVIAENGDVSVSTIRGDIVVNGTVQSKANDGIVLLTAATDANEDGGIIVNDGGNLVASGADGSVVGIAGFGKLKAEGALDDKNLSGLLKSVRMLRSGNPIPESTVRIIEGANVAAGKRIVLEGRISVISAGTIDAATARLDVTAKEGSIDLYANETGVVIAKAVSAEAGENILLGNAKNEIEQLDRVKVGRGEVDINLGKSGGKVDVIDADDFVEGFAYRVGTMLVVGDIEKNGAVYIISDEGDVVVAENCKIKASGEDASAYLQAARDIRISGNVESDGMVQMFAGRDVAQEGTINAGAVDIAAVGNIELGDVYATSATFALGDLDGDDIPDPQSIGATAISGQIRVSDGANILADDSSAATIYLTSANGLVVGKDSNVRADGANGAIFASSDGSAAPGGVKANAMDVNGTLSATKEVLVMNFNGDVNVGSNGRISSDNTAFAEAKQGDIVVDGRVESGDATFVSAMRGTGSKDVRVVVNGTVAGDNQVMIDTDCGDIKIDGNVQSTGAGGFAVVVADKSGDIAFGTGGSAKGTSGVYVKTGGGNLVHQSGASVAANNGYAESVSLPAAVEGKDIVLQVNGSVGSAAQSFAIDGNVVGLVSGDAHIAAAGGKDLKGGTKPFESFSLPKFDGNTITIDLTQLNADNAMFVGGSLSTYSAGQVQKGNVLEAGQDLTITAKTFGDVSYLQAGGMLTVNNVGHSSQPQIAYFESTNGKEPNIRSQSNDTVIFIDGRLAGGNLNILNEFGSDEAFMVNTPELKSTQGIFGAPTFIHSDLDVANPMEVGSIDYMLQETPRLTLDKDFPKEADQHVDSVVIPERDSIQFGRGAKTGESAPNPDGKIAKVK